MTTPPLEPARPQTSVEASDSEPGAWDHDHDAVHPCGTQVVWQRLVWGEGGERAVETLECSGPYSHPGWHSTADGRLFEARLITEGDRTEARVEADDARLAEELRVRGWLVERAECGDGLEGLLVPGALPEFCNRPTGHTGRHRSPGGTEWSPPVAAATEAPVVDWRGAEGRVRERELPHALSQEELDGLPSVDVSGTDRVYIGPAGAARPGPALIADDQLLRDRDGQVVGMMTAPSWARSVARSARVTAVLEGAEAVLADLAAVLGDDG